MSEAIRLALMLAMMLARTLATMVVLSLRSTNTERTTPISPMMGPTTEPKTTLGSQKAAMACSTI